MPADLPLERTSFVGRARELAELERLVGEAAIVTVVGTGGVGKTRLALQAARRLADRFPAGTWLADLGPIGSADLAVTEVARLAGVLPGSGDPVQLLAEQLGDRRVLLVLDNCEHLVEAVALLAHRLVTACPNLRVLATSREPLAVGPEVTFELPPLETGEAVRLFVERAAAVDPGFAVTDADGPVIGQLCARLDGVPLAIELAAPWVRLFSPAELLPRLADRFELLGATRRDLPPRQRTMRRPWSGATSSCPRTSRCCSAGWPPSAAASAWRRRSAWPACRRWSPGASAHCWPGCASAPWWWSSGRRRAPAGTGCWRR